MIGTLRRTMLRRAVMVPFALVIVVASAWFGFASGGKSSATASTTEQLFSVTPGTMRETVSSSGTVAPSDTEDLNFAVSGTVTAVAVKAGEKVTKGQVLATIDSATLQSQVTQAQATLDNAVAQLSTDESASASAAQIASDNANVAAAYASLASAKQSLAGSTLTSPIAGTVATVNLTVGQQLGNSGASGTNVSGSGTGSGLSSGASSNSGSASGVGGAGGAGGAAATGSSSSASPTSGQVEVISNSFVVNLSVATTDVGNLKVGQQATVTPSNSSSTSSSSGNGFAARFGGAANPGGGAANPGGSTATAAGAAATGKVASVGTIATSSSGVASFPVVVQIDGHPSDLHAGASASAVITYHALNNVLSVPVTALSRSNGQTTVVVSVGGKKQSRVVTTGLVSGGLVQVTSGLQAGDQVVLTIAARQPATGSGTNTNGRTGFPGGGAGGFPGGGAGGFPGGGAGGFRPGAAP
ncbi:MAG: efflux transporter, family, subunit [Actinomycetia bacterium]|nr:efflux transporter, family, subunit [Actinomycetes bacterium]